MAKPLVFFSRVVHQSLVDALRPGGALHAVVQTRNSASDLLDVQYRRPSGRISRASVYAGLTRIIDIDHTSSGQGELFRYFIAHDTHRADAPKWSSWAEWRPIEGLFGMWPQVESYVARRLDWIRHAPKAARHRTEGAVHASMCSPTQKEYRVINREASVSFRDIAAKARVCNKVRGAIKQTLTPVPVGKPWLKPHAFGTSPDILALDVDGRLLVAEAKPVSYDPGIAKGPIQARFYAGLFARWLQEDPAAVQTLQTMLDQRIATGLSGAGPRLAEVPEVVPVLALGPGEVSAIRKERVLELRDRLLEVAPASGGVVAPLEIWHLDDKGARAKMWT